MRYKKVEITNNVTPLSSSEIYEILKARIEIKKDEPVLILTDDLFRPDTLLHRKLLEYVVDKSGIWGTVLVVASGMHRSPTIKEIESKFG
jgi:nickel-dependent lactate racemase